MNSDHGLSKRGSRASRPCPRGHPDHQLLRLRNSVLAPLGLPRGSLVHVDRSRAPRNGDLVWAELVLAQDSARLVRRYEEGGGIVTLTAPGSGELAITVPQGELLVLGVAEPAAEASCRPDPPKTGNPLRGHDGNIWAG
jgi:SOS-response transcriptional repressor LexA